MIGVGVLPHGGDAEHHRDGSLFAILNEVDSMLDEEKNQGVQAVWGDLYNNPFTGGFFVLPQEHSLQRVQRYAKVSEGMSDSGMHAEYNGDVRADGVARRSHALYPGPG